MMKQTVAQLNNAAKGYGSDTVLGPLSLCIQQGEIVGVRGSNGAGKSTLLKLLAGVLEPDSGTVQRPEGIRIGYVPQDIALYPELTAVQNLRFWADVYKIPAASKKLRIDWLLRELKLEDKRNNKVSACSGGMKRRLNLAASLMISPALLLLDEPTAGADEESVRIILSLVKRLCTNGVSAVFVSHDLRELHAVCSRIITLDKGVVVSEEQRP